VASWSDEMAPGVMLRTLSADPRPVKGSSARAR
jgi:hypothetical protein